MTEATLSRARNSMSGLHLHLHLHQHLPSLATSRRVFWWKRATTFCLLDSLSLARNPRRLSCALLGLRCLSLENSPIPSSNCTVRAHLPRSPTTTGGATSRRRSSQRAYRRPTIWSRLLWRRCRPTTPP